MLVNLMRFFEHVDNVCALVYITLHWLLKACPVHLDGRILNRFSIPIRQGQTLVGRERSVEVLAAAWRFSFSIAWAGGGPVQFRRSIGLAVFTCQSNCGDTGCPTGLG